MSVNPKIGVLVPPKKDGENNGKPSIKIDDLGCFPPIFGNTPYEDVVSKKNGDASVFFLNLSTSYIFWEPSIRIFNGGVRLDGIKG